MPKEFTAVKPQTVVSSNSVNASIIGERTEYATLAEFLTFIEDESLNSIYKRKGNGMSGVNVFAHVTGKSAEDVQALKDVKRSELIERGNELLESYQYRLNGVPYAALQYGSEDTYETRVPVILTDSDGKTKGFNLKLNLDDSRTFLPLVKEATDYPCSDDFNFEFLPSSDTIDKPYVLFRLKA